MKVKVIAKKGFDYIKDAERSTKEKEIYFIEGDIWTTTLERAKFLREKGVVEIIEEIKEEPKSQKKGHLETFDIGTIEEPNKVLKTIIKEPEIIKPKKKKSNKKK